MGWLRKSNHGFLDKTWNDQCHQSPDQSAALLTRLPVGSSPAPSEFCITSEMVFDLADVLLHCERWDPTTIPSPCAEHSPASQHLRPCSCALGARLPVASAAPLLMDAPSAPVGPWPSAAPSLTAASSAPIDLRPPVTTVLTVVPLAPDRSCPSDAPAWTAVSSAQNGPWLLTSPHHWLRP
jgi:hypothetical protein